MALQTDLLKLIKKNVIKRATNISQQYFMKTEVSEEKTNSRSYIKPNWLGSVSLAQSPPRENPHSHSLASTDMDLGPFHRDRIQVTLSLNDWNTTINVDFNQTTDNLEVILRELLKEHDPDVKPVSFLSTDKDLQIDYFLTCSGRKLSELKRKSISLMPSFYPNPSKSNTIAMKDFLLIKCIGVGGFSRVYLVKKLSNGRFYAMKLIDKEFIIKKKTECIVRNERDIMSVVDHPFLVKLEYSFEHRNFLVFILEFCSGGELFQQLKRVKRMTESQARFYFSEVCLGMLFLHQLNICYRDIKPENILLDNQGHVRIADFGLSKPNMGGRDVAYSFCGSPEYMAPEMLRKEGHSLSVDHYCLGVLLYELVTGLPPFYSKDINQIYQAILNEPVTFPEHIDLSAEIKDLLVKLLSKDPRTRLGSKGGLSEILVHPWFRGISLTGLLDQKVQPPIVPDVCRFNFHVSENSKGMTELETVEKLVGKKGFKNDIKLFDEFYFDRQHIGDIQVEQKQFYSHYHQLVQNIEAKHFQHYRKEQKQAQFTLDTSKARKIVASSKSPTAMSNSYSKRVSPKTMMTQSQKNLKQMVSNFIHSDRYKADALKRNNSQQYDSFVQSKLIKTQMVSDRIKKRVSSLQRRNI